MDSTGTAILNAFCVDLEEWFHVCGVNTPYSSPSTWDSAPALVERDTDAILALLDEVQVKATFLVVGWIAQKYPRLVERISLLGHEIGCHGYYHRLVFEQRPEEFRQELIRSRRLLQDLSGQEVGCFRAPGFSMKRECFWALPILAEEGIGIDVSIVPASRDHGGVEGLRPNPFLLRTEFGQLTVFPNSIMRVAGRTVPFSGGGYLRFFPLALIHHGFRQNQRRNLPVMAYIHPREINPDQPRIPLPWLKRFKYYVGLRGCEKKLRHLLRAYRFGTVTATLRACRLSLPTLYLAADGRHFQSTPPMGRAWEDRDAVKRRRPLAL